MLYSSRFFVLIVFSLALMNCNKDPDQSGCTDPMAVNYNPAALRSDNSCKYNDAKQIIWQNGMRGGWNNDLQQGAFKLETCAGEVREVIYEADSAYAQHVLYFGTDNENEHKSVFSVINVQNGRDFAEGSLRMGVRFPGEGHPEYMRLYINGKIPDRAICTSHKRSEFIEISTHGFNDSTFTEVNIPMRNFAKIQMGNIHVVCGIEFEGDRNSGIEVDEIKWVAHTQE